MILRRSKMAPFSASVLLLALVVLCAAPIQSAALDLSQKTEKGIVYATVDGVALKLDIAYPTDGKPPYPGLIYICGNGWGWYPTINRSQYSYDITAAAKKGYVAVTVDYRYTSIKDQGKTKYQFPAQLYDVKCAVRWLRSNGQKYRLDPGRIGAIGWSSGGHLALMLGLTSASDSLEGECGNLSVSSKVQAVVNIAGGTDLESLFKESPTVAPMIKQLLGGTPQEVSARYFAASPINYVSSDDAPVLTIQGDNDTTVVPRQSEMLDAKMQKIGLQHSLIWKKGSGHGNYSTENAMWEFLDRLLK